MADDISPLSPSRYRPVVFHDPNVAIGIAARLMLDRPAFAALAFGPWMSATVAQADRGHVRFFLDEADAVRGFIGWALTDRARAEAWAEANIDLPDALCREGDCIIFNVWIGVDRDVHRAMVKEGRRVCAGKTTAYYKRIYPDGRVRPIRLPLTDSIETHP